MRTLILVAVFLMFPGVLWANDNCKDENFNGAVDRNYRAFKEVKSFEGFQTFESPAPAGFYGLSADRICYHMNATYFSHKATGKKYVMYTTHDDYCDGGNTWGFVVDIETYKKQKTKEAVVADIGDHYLTCIKKK